MWRACYARRGSRLAFENGSTLSPGTFDGVQYTLMPQVLPIDTRRIDQYRSTRAPAQVGREHVSDRQTRTPDAAPARSLLSLFPSLGMDMTTLGGGSTEYQCVHLPSTP